MNKIVLLVLAVFPVTAVFAQETTSTANSSPVPTVSNTTQATAADVETLRQQVQSLTETVKSLQQQVKNQQAALEKANLTGESGLATNPEPSPISGAEESPAPSGGAPPQFPTEDSSVVSSASSAPSPGPRAAGALTSEAFPTTDTSVVTSAPETLSIT